MPDLTAMICLPLPPAAVFDEAGAEVNLGRS